MRCPKCGQPAQPGGRFCGRCGYSFTVSGAMPGHGRGGSDHARQGDDGMTGEWDAVSFQNPAPGTITAPAALGRDHGQQAAATAAAPVVTRQGRATAEGTARDVRFRTESVQLPTSQSPSPVQVLTFRLERYDPRGDRLSPIGVEMRGPSISGALSEGENAYVVGSYGFGTIRADRIINRTTGAVITASRAITKLTIIGWALTAIVAITFIIFMISASR
jgi:hypothetical protein